jgi:hypothetical protein
MGRSSLYTVELGDTICDQLAEGGKSLRSICRDLEISYATVLTWVRDSEDFSNQYARAREVGNDADFEGLLDLAAQPPPKVKGFSDSGWVSWQKNLVDAHKWSLSKRCPKKYGDKLDLNMAGSLNVTTMSEEEIDAKLATLLAQSIKEAGTAGTVGGEGTPNEA